MKEEEKESENRQMKRKTEKADKVEAAPGVTEGSLRRFRAALIVFGCTSRTVSYAWELTSVSMCYPQGDGFNTSLSRLLPDSDPLEASVLERVYKRPCLLGVVMFGGTVMCYPGRL